MAPFGLAPGDAHAQWHDLLELEVGDSLRVRLPGALRVDVSMQGWQRDTLMLRVEGLRTLWPVSGFDLETLEKFGDRTPREGLRHGAAIGMATGIFAGAAVGLLLEVTGEPDETDVAQRVIGAAVRWAGMGAVAGTIGGAVLGGRRPGRGWVLLELPSR